MRRRLTRLTGGSACRRCCGATSARSRCCRAAWRRSRCSPTTQTRGLVSPAQIPLLFALAMLVDGLSGLVMGRVYDRRGAYVLLAVPVAACAAAIAFGANAALVWLGVAIWGVVNGVLDSTVKAVVTELVDRDARPSAFGWLALVRGVGLLVAGAVLGVAYDHSVTLTIALIVAANVVALAGLWSVISRGASSISQMSSSASPPTA